MSDEHARGQGWVAGTHTGKLVLQAHCAHSLPHHAAFNPGTQVDVVIL